MSRLLELLTGFGVLDGASRAALVWLGLGCAAVLFLRICLTLKYQSALSMFSLTAKRAKISAKADLGAIKTGLLGWTLKEYIRLAERGVSGVNTREIVERGLLGMSLFGWNCKSVSRFVEAVEGAVLVIVPVLAFFFESRQGIIIIGAGVFLALRLCASIFDYSVVREKLAAAIGAFIDFEAGRFFARDAVSAIGLLRSEMAAASAAQTKSLEALAGKTVGGVRESARAWEGAAAKGLELQERINAAAGSVALAFEALEKSNDDAAALVKNFDDRLDSHYGRLGGLINTLSEGISELKESNAAVEIKSGAVEEQLALVKANQKALESGLARFESALGAMAVETGKGFGRMVDIHARELYGALGAEIQGYIRQIFAANNETAERLNGLFESLREQSRAEAAAMMSIRDQIAGTDGGGL